VHAALHQEERLALLRPAGLGCTRSFVGILFLYCLLFSSTLLCCAPQLASCGSQSGRASQSCDVLAFLWPCLTFDACQGISAGQGGGCWMCINSCLSMAFTRLMAGRGHLEDSFWGDFVHLCVDWVPVCSARTRKACTSRHCEAEAAQCTRGDCACYALGWWFSCCELGVHCWIVGETVLFPGLILDPYRIRTGRCGRTNLQCQGCCSPVHEHTCCDSYMIAVCACVCNVCRRCQAEHAVHRRSSPHCPHAPPLSSPPDNMHPHVWHGPKHSGLWCLRHTTCVCTCRVNLPTAQIGLVSVPQ
jgi:hypothetical protein